jgi:hypothetical protein
VEDRVRAIDDIVQDACLPSTQLHLSVVGAELRFLCRSHSATAGHFDLPQRLGLLWATAIPIAVSPIWIWIWILIVSVGWLVGLLGLICRVHGLDVASSIGLVVVA